MIKLSSILRTCLAGMFASATIIYDANVNAIITLLDAGGMFISADSGPEVPSALTSGSGVASIDADSQSDPALFPGSPLVQSSEVSGSAGPTPGTSSAVSMNSYKLTLVNSEDTVATAVFEFTYDWDVSLSQAPASEAEFESGMASAFFHLSGFAPSGTETLAIDDLSGSGIMPVADWLFHPMLSFEFDDIVTPGALIGSTTVLAYVTVPAFSTDQFSVITDAFGGAVRVSEPGLALLLCMSLMLVVRRAKQK